jgi:hypothetical protein
MSISENLLLAMFIIFALPWAVWRALGGTVILPLVVVQIIAGILLGPGVLGAWSPDTYNALFRVEVIAGINLPMLIKLASVRKGDEMREAVAKAQEAGRKYISVASQVLAGETS